MNSGSGIYEAAFKAFFNLHQLVHCHIHYVNIMYDLNLDILHMFTILHNIIMCSTICSTLYVQYVELCMCWKLQKKIVYIHTCVHLYVYMVELLKIYV